jgi:hypothetical protein
MADERRRSKRFTNLNIREILPSEQVQAWHATLGSMNHPVLTHRGPDTERRADRENTMLRNLAFVAAATATIGFAALAPTTASAHGHRHFGFHGNSGWGHNHWRGPHFAYRPQVYAYNNPCIRTRWVRTPWGPQLRRVNVCY